MFRLMHFTKELSLAADLPSIQRISRRAVRELTGADGVTFVLREDDNCHYADEDAIAPLWKGCRFPMSACISGWVMLNRQPVAIPDIRLDPRIPQDAYRPTFVRSLLMVPIRSNEPIGAIGVYWARLHEATEAETAVAQAIADAASEAMARLEARIELEARIDRHRREIESLDEALRTLDPIDTLTGFYNLGGFRRLAEQSLAAARRLGTRLYYAEFGIEGYDNIPERLGRRGQTLIALADSLRRGFRNADILSRLDRRRFGVLGSIVPAAATDAEAALSRVVSAFDAQNAEFAAVLRAGIQEWDPGQTIPLDSRLAAMATALHAGNRYRVA